MPMPCTREEKNASEARYVERRERLAAYAHEAWSGWMKYLFSKCKDARCADDAHVAIPGWAVKRWQRQMNTPYAELPEDEKESDRAEADKMLAILQGLRGDG